MRRTLLCSALLLSSCSLFANQTRIDSSDGVPDLAGDQVVTLPTNFMCGTPITENGVTVTTAPVTGGCQFTLDQDIEVVKAADYQQAGMLATIGSQLVKSVEIQVVTLEFRDATTGTKLDTATRVTSATLSINGQQVADKAALSTLPLTITLEGQALEPIKAKVKNKEPVSVRATAVVVLPNTPAPPAKLGIKYLAKPALNLGV